MQTVRDKVAEQAGAIAGVFAPAMKMLRVEGGAGLDGPEPALPINIGGGGFFIDLIIPFAPLVVPAIVALAPDKGANFAALDQFGAFVPALRGTALRTDLESA